MRKTRKSSIQFLWEEIIWGISSGFVLRRLTMRGKWREDCGWGEGRGHSVEYRANVPLVLFNSLHLGGLRQRSSSSQIFFVMNLCLNKEWKQPDVSVTFCSKTMSANSLTQLLKGTWLSSTVQSTNNKTEWENQTNSKHTTTHKLCTNRHKRCTTNTF